MEAINSKNSIKEKLSKYNKKLVGKTTLKEARYALWEQLVLEVIKFRTHIEVVEEFETTNVSLPKCDFIAHELTHRPIEVAQRMIDFMRTTSKTYLQVLKVEDRTSMTTLENKSICKHKYVCSVISKE